MNKIKKGIKIDNLEQEQLIFDIKESKYKKLNKEAFNLYDCIEKYKYIGIDSYKQYSFEKDWSLNECIIASDSGEEVESLRLPLLSEISAGSPIYMNEEYEEYFHIPRELIRNDKGIFILKVKGDSMIDAGIEDGDYVIIKKDNYINKKSIVAVDVNGYATLKRIESQGDTLILIPENKNYESIMVKANEARIIGGAVGIIKNII
ncbi:MAG: transcriptional repressor LexA [Peptostreptococcaceae bacterium]